jgi:hypothetical protein
MAVLLPFPESRAGRGQVIRVAKGPWRNTSAQLRRSAHRHRSGQRASVEIKAQRRWTGNLFREGRSGSVRCRAGFTISRGGSSGDTCSGTITGAGRAIETLAREVGARRRPAPITRYPNPIRTWPPRFAGAVFSCAQTDANDITTATWFKRDYGGWRAPLSWLRPICSPSPVRAPSTALCSRHRSRGGCRIQSEPIVEASSAFAASAYAIPMEQRDVGRSERQHSRGASFRNGLVGTVASVRRGRLAHQLRSVKIVETLPPHPAPSRPIPPHPARSGTLAQLNATRTPSCTVGTDLGLRVGFGRHAFRRCRISRGRRSLPYRTDPGGAVAALRRRRVAHPGGAGAARVGCGVEFMGMTHEILHL